MIIPTWLFGLSLRWHQPAGMVTSGNPSLPPVSVSDIRIIRNAKVRLDRKSRLSIQNQ